VALPPAPGLKTKTATAQHITLQSDIQTNINIVSWTKQSDGQLTVVRKHVIWAKRPTINTRDIV